MVRGISGGRRSLWKFGFNPFFTDENSFERLPGARLQPPGWIDARGMSIWISRYGGILCYRRISHQVARPAQANRASDVGGKATRGIRKFTGALA